MHAAGTALAVPGNHEFNAIVCATPDGNGDFLRKHTPRKHTPRNHPTHAATREQLAAHQDEWHNWVT